MGLTNKMKIVISSFKVVVTQSSTIQNNDEMRMAYETELQRLRTELAQKIEQCEHWADAETKLQQLTVIAQQWQNEAEKYKQWALQWQSYQLSQVNNKIILTNLFSFILLIN